MSPKRIQIGMELNADVCCETTIKGKVVRIDEDGWVTIAVPCKVCGKTTEKTVHARELYKDKIQNGINPCRVGSE